jgi:hypothetical protein
MRPLAFTGSGGTSFRKLSRIGAQMFRYRVSYADGSGDSVTVVVTRSAREFANAYPNDVDPAVRGAIDTDGRTVVYSQVINRDRPPLSWIVHAEGIFPAPRRAA